MRDYSKVSGQFWTGRTGKRLRGDMEGQIVALYLMTSPHANMIGVYQVPLLYIAHETGLTIEGTSKGLDSCIKGAFCSYDSDTETVFVVEMAAHQVGDTIQGNDKRRPAIQKMADAIAETHIYQAFMARYAEPYGLVSKLKTDSSSEGASMPLRSQKQEQEQEQKQKGEKLYSSADAVVATDDGNVSPIDPCPHEAIIALYHDLLPANPRIKAWSNTRRAHLRSRWREDPKRQNLDYWRRLFAHVAASAFLTGRAPGRGERPFFASLDWIVQPENFAKVIEGRYHPRSAP